MTIDTRLLSASLSLHKYINLIINKLCDFGNFAKINSAVDV